MKLDGDAKANVDGIPTGSLSLDIALGGNGVPRGRVLEVFGPESSGKTTLTLHIIANAQKWAASPRLSTPSTPSIRPGPSGLAFTSTIFWSPSPTPASKRWKSASFWFDPTPWMSSSSTRLPL